MGDEDIEVRAFAEQNLNPGNWDSAVRFEGECLIGCKGRKMLRTKNLLKAIDWAAFHRGGQEHQELLVKRREDGTGADRHEHSVGPSAP